LRTILEQNAKIFGFGEAKRYRLRHKTTPADNPASGLSDQTQNMLDTFLSLIDVALGVKAIVNQANDPMGWASTAERTHSAQ